MRAVQSPVAFLEANNPKQVRVFAADGELYVLRDPQLRGDTVRGYETLVQEELSVSLNGIRRMEAVQPDKTRTTLFIGAVTVLAGAGVYMISQAGQGKALICDNYPLPNRCVEKQPGAPRPRIDLPLLRF
jgi:hypothetical protein